MRKNAEIVSCNLRCKEDAWNRAYCVFAGGYKLKRTIIRALITVSSTLLAVDIIYKTINNINYFTRHKCILYRLLPKGGFLFFEYFIELTIWVFVGIFLATLLKKYFSTYQRFYPKNVIGAFVYASLLPVCSCAVIPLLKTMKGTLNLRTLITFTVAAPLLSPYIITLSFLVLGVEYGILRIACSFILAVSSGYVLEFFDHKRNNVTLDKPETGDDKFCPAQATDIYLDTYSIFRKILPYLILAGIAGIAFELLPLRDFLLNSKITNNLLGMMMVILIGIPLYFCYGAEVLVLRPLIHSGGFPLGTAMAFSLTSTAICITSIIMLFQFLGKRLTAILLGNIIIATLILGYVINLFYQ